jgi:hypothetical protein
MRALIEQGVLLLIMAGAVVGAIWCWIELR